MKKLFLVICFLLVSTRASAQQSLSFGVAQTSLDAVAGGAGTIGTAYAAPPGGDATLVTWTTVYSAPPASVTMLLQASLDNVTWFTLDTSTAVAGELRNIATSARFFRCNLSAVSGAVNKSCSFVLKRSNAAVSSSGSVFAGNVTSGGRFLAADGTQGAPAYSFTNYPANGLFALTAASGVPSMSSGGINRMAWFSGLIQMASSETLGWSSGAINSATDVSLRRGGAGNLLLGNATSPTDFGLLQFGGTTSAFPALKRSGTDLQVRLADDSNSSGMAMRYISFNSTLFASLGTPGNGQMLYCSDCTITAVCAGSGTGAFAKRLNGVWVCN